ncbi:MAG: hypothetical protein AB1633_05395 [Elusimicrobiota bacterium]
MNKKLIALVFASLISGALTNVFAWGNNGDWEKKAEMRHKKHVEKLTKELALSKEQSEKISQILKDGWEKISAERKKIRELSRQIREETDKSIEQLLIPEQVEKFKKYREEMKKKFSKRMKKWKPRCANE